MCAENLRNAEQNPTAFIRFLSNIIIRKPTQQTFVNRIIVKRNNIKLKTKTDIYYTFKEDICKQASLATLQLLKSSSELMIASLFEEGATVSQSMI